MSPASYWWIAAGVIVGLELISGTFYLLMLSIGAVAGGLIAFLGGDLDAQMVVAAIVGLLAVGAWHYWRINHPNLGNTADSANPDLHLDVGQTLTVIAWGPDARARVQYRGTQWDAELHSPAHHQPGALPLAGLHRIRAVQGNVLVLEKI